MRQYFFGVIAMMMMIPSDFGLRFGWVEEKEKGDERRLPGDVLMKIDGERETRDDVAVRPRESPSRGHS